MRILGILMVVIGYVFTSAAAAKKPLALKLIVDVSDVGGIEEFDGGEDALRDRLHRQIQAHFSDEYQTFWRIDPASSLHELTLKLDMDIRNQLPEFTFSLEPNGGSKIKERSTKKVGTPAQSTRFKRRLREAMRKALKGSYDKFYNVSEHIQDNWNFGITTKIQINRTLSQDEVGKFRDDQLVVSWPHTFQTMELASAPPEPFSHNLALSPAISRMARIRTTAHEGQLIQPSDTLAELCIRRDVPETPQGVQPQATYSCPVTGTCTLQSSEPDGWASDGCADQGFLMPFLHKTLGITEAYAKEFEGEVWTVPTLSTLYDRLESEKGGFIGFTDFEIEAEQLDDLQADSFTMEVLANGTPVWLDGVPPIENRRRYSAKNGLLVRFGLENLQFAGRKNGCETLKVKLNFFKDNKPIDKSLTLTRQYAALRNAKESVIDTPNGRFNWSGRYQSPGERRETGLFVISSNVFHKDDKQAAIEARQFLNEKRKILDAFNWTLKRSELGGTIGNAGGAAGSDDLKIVGKIRPPTKARPNGGVAYGLQVGTEQPNGQLQFSFDSKQISKLRTFLLKLRQTEPKARAIIPGKIDDFYRYTYTEARKDAPNWVCDL